MFKNSRRIITFAAAALLGGGILAAPLSAVAQQGEPVRWNMQSWFPSEVPLVGSLGVDITEKVERVSGGNIRLRFQEPGALVEPQQCFDSVSEGALDSCWTVAGYWIGKDPAFAIFSAVPFGPAWPEMLAWFYYGGGKELYEELYHSYNIHPVVCGGTVPEASGWFTEEVSTPEDLEGFKMRIFGLGAKVLDRLGVSTQLMAAGDIFPALELGTIDATEFAMPSVDLQLGFHQVADYYYFPGWHQPATFYEVIFNLDQWNSLTDTQQAQIEMVCGDNVRQAIAEGEYQQIAALKEFKEKGVNIREWPPETLQTFRETWHEVAADLSEESENFKEAWNSLQAFREDYETWHDLGYVDE